MDSHSNFITFTAEYSASTDEIVLVTGNQIAIGWMDPEKALALETSDNKNWKAKLAAEFPQDDRV